MVPAGVEPAELPADAIEVGRIADAWGIQGWFKVLPHSADPQALFSSKRWYLQPTEKGTPTFSGTVLLRVREAKEHSDSIVARADAVGDRNAAELLKGARIFVPRSSFPTAAEDEYYWVDLLGLDVVNREGVHLGKVKELLSTGPQTVLVVESEAEPGKPLERMIPFVAVYVDRVDREGRRIDVDWQADY
jgi:16S rRNA processing protein RimM